MISGFRRWAPWLALVLVFSLVTTLLALWQFDRREQRVAKIDLVIANYDKMPVDLSEIRWTLAENELSEQEWRPVRVSGSYLPQESLLVRNRPLNGQPGYLQLVPFRTADGRILIVERGWLPTGSNKGLPDVNPLPDSQPRELVVRLRSSEQDLGRDAVAGQVASIYLPALAELPGLGGELIEEFYGRLVSESPSSEAFPFQMPKPSLSEGNHLSYAIQWLVFGLMAFGALIWTYRNDRRLALEAQGLVKPKIRRNTQREKDAEAEDERL